MSIRRKAGIGATVGVAAVALLIALVSSGASPAKAYAASCQSIQTPLASGTLTVEGGDCRIYSEEIVVDCLGGSVWTAYWIIDQPVPGPAEVTNSGVACASVSRLVVNGHEGFDTLDLRTVTPATGFTAIGSNQNQINGGDGPDTMIGSMYGDAFAGGNDGDRMFARDGATDSVDCGAGADLAETDRPSLDPVVGCEAVFALPEPAAKKKGCKKRRGKGAARAKKCKKKRK